MRNNVPYHLAMEEMDEAEVIAQCAIFGGFEGMQFDWDSFGWLPHA